MEAAPGSQPGMQFLPHVDELVMEYLLFRGFTKSFQVFNAERKRDRAKGFDVEQIITQLLSYVQTYQLEPMLETWKFLSARFFRHMDASYTATIHELEDSWLRLYVVNAIKTGRREKAIEFFTLLYADRLHATLPMNRSMETGDSWSRWFVVPYIQNPESDAYFRAYFTKKWLEDFVTSFRNFLSVIFRNMPLPKLLAFQISRLAEPSLKLQLRASRSECSRLRLSSLKANERIRMLEETGRQLYDMINTLVQHTFVDHFAGMDNESGPSSSSPSSSPVLGPAGAPTSSTALQAMHRLTSQLASLSRVFNPNWESKNGGDHGALLDPLQLTLPQVSSSPTGSEAISPREQSPASLSGSSLLRPQLSFPSAKEESNPVLIDEWALTDEAGDAHPYTAACVFSPDGDFVATHRAQSRQINLYHFLPPRSFNLHATIHASADVVGVDWFSRKNQLLMVYALRDGTINLWDGKTRSRTTSIPSSDSNISFPMLLVCGQNSRLGAVAVIDEDNDQRSNSTTSVEIFSIQENNEIAMRSSIKPEGSEVSSLDWASDGSILVIGCVDGSISLWDPIEAKQIGCSWLVDSTDSLNSDVDARAYFAPDGQSVLTTNRGHLVVTEWITDKEFRVEGIDQPAVATRYHLPLGHTVARSSAGCTHRKPIRWDSSGDHFFIVCENSERHDDATLAALVMFKRGVSEPMSPPAMFRASDVTDVDWHLSTQRCAVATSGDKLSLWNYQVKTT